jgi:hypothetical protein
MSFESQIQKRENIYIESLILKQDISYEKNTIN